MLMVVFHHAIGQMQLGCEYIPPRGESNQVFCYICGSRGTFLVQLSLLFYFVSAGVSVAIKLGSSKSFSLQRMCYWMQRDFHCLAHILLSTMTKLTAITLSLIPKNYFILTQFHPACWESQGVFYSISIKHVKVFQGDRYTSVISVNSLVFGVNWKIMRT